VQYRASTVVENVLASGEKTDAGTTPQNSMHYFLNANASCLLGEYFMKKRNFIHFR
jgi:hypothetical protein